MSLLILGAGGLLGSALVARSLSENQSVVGTYHSESPAFDIPLERHDIRDIEAFREILDKHQPDTVVNCAAMTDVDRCQSDEEMAFSVNGQAPGDLARACKKYGVQFIHISTDYVFDGEATKPYHERETTNPIQVYGKSKLEGERRVRRAMEDALILRLSFVYGVRGDTGELVGFPSWVREMLRSGKKVPLFVDQHISPSRVGQVSQTILELLAVDAAGTYHVAARSCVTPYKFGKAITHIQDADSKLLQESKKSNISRKADRPSYTCLDVSKLECVLDRKQPTLEMEIYAIAEQF